MFGVIENNGVLQWHSRRVGLVLLRYLIVVDDIWDSNSWKIIKYAFIKNSCGSRIITTTRKIEVAESCCLSHGDHIYELWPLNPENSRRLFLKRIFGSEECPSHLTKVCDEILKKCDGLPLAIIAIAGLLASKAQTFDEWNKVQSSFGYALERHSDVNGMMRILSLSYFDLPPHLQSCLLYLSIFPEDYVIQKERLILRWIAEGFIHEEHGYTQYECGERCFNELINRSLILVENSDTLGSLLSCRVHDTILEFIVSKAVDENFVTLFGVPNITVDPRRKIRRLSLQDKSNVGDTFSLPENLIYSHVRAVSVFASNLVNLPSLLKFRYVRTLDLENCEGLQAHHLAHLGRLFALRYLSLRDTRVHELPKEIGELQFLETLDIRGNKITELPSSVVCLARLVSLLCDPDVKLPDGFRSMQALQKMGRIDLLGQSPSFAQELGQLTNLRKLQVNLGKGNYSTTSQKGMDVFTKDVISSLCRLGTGSLSSLTMIVYNEANKDSVLEPWSPAPRRLKQLVISGISFPRVPGWIGSLDNLQELFLNVEQLGPADVGLLGRIPALSCLHLSVATEASDGSSSSSSSQETQQVKIGGAHGFPCLRLLHVGSDDCGLGLLFEAGAMPKLQELTLQFHEAQTRPLSNGEFDFGIHHLPCLATVTCSVSMMEQDPSCKLGDTALDAVKTAVRSHPNHPRIYEF